MVAGSALLSETVVVTGGAGTGPGSLVPIEVNESVTRYFSLVDFHVIEPDELHFQSLTMRRPA